MFKDLLSHLINCLNNQNVISSARDNNAISEYLQREMDRYLRNASPIGIKSMGDSKLIDEMNIDIGNSMDRKKNEDVEVNEILGRIELKKFQLMIENRLRGHNSLL